jgi:hypothetical protein
MAVSTTPTINMPASSPYASFVRDALASSGGSDRAEQVRAQAEAQGRQQAENRARSAPPAGQGTKVDLSV